MPWGSSNRLHINPACYCRTAFISMPTEISRSQPNWPDWFDSVVSPPRKRLFNKTCRRQRAGVVAKSRDKLHTYR